LGKERLLDYVEAFREANAKARESNHGKTEIKIRALRKKEISKVLMYSVERRAQRCGRVLAVDMSLHHQISGSSKESKRARLALGILEKSNCLQPKGVEESETWLERMTMGII
jgi:hypothetical protein